MQLQQGFTIGGMGSDRYFAWQQFIVRMSALGQKQTSPYVGVMSRLLKTDLRANNGSSSDKKS